MFAVHVEKIGDVAIIQCEGRMIGSDAAFQLHDEVRRQEDSNFVLLDFSELSFMGGNVLDMLVCLQAWAREHDIQFRLFNPSHGMRLSIHSATTELEIASMDDVLSMLHWEGPRNRVCEAEFKARRLSAA